MYTVKKILAGNTYHNADGIEYKCTHNAWAVFHKARIARFKDEQSGKMVDEIYSTRNTAQLEADFLNNNSKGE